MAIGETVESSARKLQSAVNKVAIWTKEKWRIKLDESKAVTNIIAKFANSHEKRLQDHINIKASRLLNVNNITRRLKRKKPVELVRR
jgi:uncharacterized protein YeeX (DUF496 family)